MKLAVRLVAVLLLAGLLIQAALPGRGSQPDDANVVARVGDQVLTLDDLHRRIATIDPSMRSNLGQSERRLELVAQLVDEMLFAQAAVARGLDRDPILRAAIADARRALLAAGYQESLRPLAIPDSTTVERYYREHPEEFTVLERVTGRQIVVATELGAWRVRRQLQSGTPIDSLVTLSIDELTRGLGGSLGIVSPTLPVRGVGRNPEFVAALMRLQPGELSEPLRTTLGYHVVLVESNEPARVRPLQAVWDPLIRRLARRRLQQLKQTRLESLRVARRVEIRPEVIRDDDHYRIAEARELFNRAAQTRDPRRRLDLYGRVLERAPDADFAVEALFKRGFILIEELDDPEGGRAELERLLADYPDADQVDSTRWMLKNLDDTSTDAGEPRSPVPPADTGG